MSDSLDIDKSKNYSPTLAFRQQAQGKTNIANPQAIYPDTSTNHSNDSQSSQIIPDTQAKTSLPFVQRTNKPLLMKNQTQPSFSNTTENKYRNINNHPIKPITHSVTTNIGRLDNILKNPLQRNSPISNINPEQNNNNLLIDDNDQDNKDTFFGNVSNTISMASIPLPPLPVAKSTSQKSVNLGYIDLTSDEDSDDEINFATLAKLNNKYSQIESKAQSPNIQPVSKTNNLEKIKTIENEPNSSIKSNPNNKGSIKSDLLKFSYNDPNDKSDSDSDDDIIITGVGHNPNPSLLNNTANNPTSSINNNDVNNFLISNDASQGTFKRKPTADDIFQLDAKRQEIIKNKLEMVQKNVIKEENFQNLLNKKAEMEKKRIEKERINKLLEKYPPIKALPTKYQIEFPKDSNAIFEPVPILPDSIQKIEVIQDVASNVPSELRVTKFRWENLDAINSIVYRLNKLNDLHSRLDKFLHDAAGMRNTVQEKAIKSAGIKKADIRYNQILRFMDSKIKQLSKNYGIVGSEVIKMRTSKKEIIQRSSMIEEMRSLFILNKKLPTEIPPVQPYSIILSQVNLVINTITLMCKLTGMSSSDSLQIIREFSLKAPPTPSIPTPEVPELQFPKPEINLYDDELSIINERQIPGDDDMSSFMPFSNIYDNNLRNMNPYGHDFNDSDGIKNLMESIKITEFEEEGLANTPDDLCISLLKHQRIGLSWMLKCEEGSNKGGILADDMGLGKTIQAISLIVANKAKDENIKTNIIVGPVSLLNQWQQEIAMKVKDDKKLSTFLYHSSNKIKSFKEISNYDVVLISYQTLGSEWKKHYAQQLDEMNKNPRKAKLYNGKNYISPFFANESVFYRIILDEAQYIKNKNTIASKAVASLSSMYRWCLSGTPIQNKIEELYPLIRFLGIKPYNDWNRFNQQIVISAKHRNRSAHTKIHALLSAILLRRTKDSEIDGKPILTLPEKHIIEEKIEMQEEEKKFYNSLENSSAKQADKLMKSNNNTYSSILTLLLRMRQAADHEYLVRLGDDGDRVSKLERFSNGYKALLNFSNVVKRMINNNMNTGFTCMNCYEELADGQTLLLSNCGHAICYDCHADYFDTNAETRWEGDISAKCKECSQLNESSKSVDLRLYEAYEEGLTWPQIRKKFELDSRASDKTWRMNTIKKFIENDGKLFISAKIAKTVELVKNIFETKPNEKVIVFSQFIGYFDILKLLLKEQNIDYLQYDGSMDIETKNECVNAFYKNFDKKLLLLSLKAGNVGLTLTCANHVIIAEPFWNPYVEKQAQDRVHRISQTREVYVHRLLIAGTIEDRIMELQKEKEELVESALDPSARSKIGKLSRRELGFLFGLNGLAELEND